jgi:hypothetical protein
VTSAIIGFEDIHRELVCPTEWGSAQVTSLFGKRLTRALPLEARPHATRQYLSRPPAHDARHRHRDRSKLDALLRFVDDLPPDRVYVDRATAIDAFHQRDMFNVIDLETGWKVDLILRKSRPFSRSEFERREAVEWMGVRLFVVTAEGVVLSKLEWAQLCGGSERQMRDVAGVLEMHRGRLDFRYIETWLDVLGVRESWEAVKGTQGSDGPVR